MIFIKKCFVYLNFAEIFYCFRNNSNTQNYLNSNGTYCVLCGLLLQGFSAVVWWLCGLYSLHSWFIFSSFSGCRTLYTQSRGAGRCLRLVHHICTLTRPVRKQVLFQIRKSYLHKDDVSPINTYAILDNFWSI